MSKKYIYGRSDWNTSLYRLDANNLSASSLNKFGKGWLDGITEIDISDNYIARCMLYDEVVKVYKAPGVEIWQDDYNKTLGTEDAKVFKIFINEEENIIITLASAGDIYSQYNKIGIIWRKLDTGELIKLDFFESPVGSRLDFAQKLMISGGAILCKCQIYPENTNINRPYWQLICINGLQVDSRSIPSMFNVGVNESAEIDNVGFVFEPSPYRKDKNDKFALIASSKSKNKEYIAEITPYLGVLSVANITTSNSLKNVNHFGYRKDELYNINILKNDNLIIKRTFDGTRLVSSETIHDNDSNEVSIADLNFTRARGINDILYLNTHIANGIPNPSILHEVDSDLNILKKSDGNIPHFEDMVLSDNEWNLSGPLTGQSAWEFDPNFEGYTWKELNVIGGDDLWYSDCHNVLFNNECTKMYLVVDNHRWSEEDGYIWEYTIATSTWNKLPNRHVEGHSNGPYSSVFYNNKIFCLNGGYNSSPYGRYYDLETNEWHIIADCPFVNGGHFHCQAIKVDNKVFLMGGEDNIDILNKVSIFNLDVLEWEKSLAMGEYVTEGGNCYHKGRFYHMGGNYTLNWDDFNGLYAYDIQTGISNTYIMPGIDNSRPPYEQYCFSLNDRVIMPIGSSFDNYCMLGISYDANTNTWYNLPCETPYELLNKKLCVALNEKTGVIYATVEGRVWIYSTDNKPPLIESINSNTDILIDYVAIDDKGIVKHELAIESVNGSLDNYREIIPTVGDSNENFSFKLQDGEDASISKARLRVTDEEGLTGEKDFEILLVESQSRTDAPATIEVFDVIGEKDSPIQVKFKVKTGVGITTFEFSDDGENYKAISPNKIWNDYTFEVLYTLTGVFTCKIRVLDGIGQETVSDDFTITVDFPTTEPLPPPVPPKVADSEYIVLYDANSNEFESNGLGILTDVLECTVDNEQNGIYELTLKYPVTGKLSDKLLDTENIIKCKSDVSDKIAQLFRIYDSEYIMESNIIIVKANHISYDLKDDFVESVNLTNVSCKQATQTLMNRAIGNDRFVVESNVESSNNFKIARVNILEALVGVEGSIFDTYTGSKQLKIHRDNFKFNIDLDAEKDNGIIIAYKKNLVGFKRKISTDNVITKIYPYKHLNNGGILTLTEKFITSDTKYSIEKIKAIEFDADSIVDESTLRSHSTNYFASNCDKPQINYEVDFVHLYSSNPSMREKFKALEQIILDDTVTVQDERIGLNVKAKVIRTVYNVLSKRYEKIELGNFKNEYRTTKKNEQNDLKRTIRSVIN